MLLDNLSSVFHEKRPGLRLPEIKKSKTMLIVEANTVLVEMTLKFKRLCKKHQHAFRSKVFKNFTQVRFSKTLSKFRDAKNKIFHEPGFIVRFTIEIFHLTRLNFETRSSHNTTCHTKCI